jgi:hypothetical protein
MIFYPETCLKIVVEIDNVQQKRYHNEQMAKHFKLPFR